MYPVHGSIRPGYPVLHIVSCAVRYCFVKCGLTPFAVFRQHHRAHVCQCNGGIISGAKVALALPGAFYLVGCKVHLIRAQPAGIECQFQPGCRVRKFGNGIFHFFLGKGQVAHIGSGVHYAVYVAGGIVERCEAVVEIKRLQPAIYYQLYELIFGMVGHAGGKYIIQLFVHLLVGQFRQYLGIGFAYNIVPLAPYVQNGLVGQLYAHFPAHIYTYRKGGIGHHSAHPLRAFFHLAACMCLSGHLNAHRHDAIYFPIQII